MMHASPWTNFPRWSRGCCAPLCHAMRVLELFAGIGGMRLAAEQACAALGLVIVAITAVDTSPTTATCYEHNFGADPPVVRRNIESMAAEVCVGLCGVYCPSFLFWFSNCFVSALRPSVRGLRPPSIADRGFGRSPSRLWHHRSRPPPSSSSRASISGRSRRRARRALDRSRATRVDARRSRQDRTARASSLHRTQRMPPATHPPLTP